MLRFSPFQREILDVLETTGEGYLMPLVCDCAARFPDLAPDRLLAWTMDSICGLMRLGWVGAFSELVDTEDAKPARIILTVREVSALRERGVIGWSEDDERWRWDARIGGPWRVGLQLATGKARDGQVAG